MISWIAVCLHRRKMSAIGRPHPASYLEGLSTAGRHEKFGNMCSKSKGGTSQIWWVPAAQRSGLDVASLAPAVLMQRGRNLRSRAGRHARDFVVRLRRIILFSGRFDVLPNPGFVGPISAKWLVPPLRTSSSFPSPRVSPIVSATGFVLNPRVIELAAAVSAYSSYVSCFLGSTGCGGAVGFSPELRGHRRGGSPCDLLVAAHCWRIRQESASSVRCPLEPRQSPGMACGRSQKVGAITPAVAYVPFVP